MVQQQWGRGLCAQLQRAAGCAAARKRQRVQAQAWALPALQQSTQAVVHKANTSASAVGGASQQQERTAPL